MNTSDKKILRIHTSIILFILILTFAFFFISCKNEELQTIEGSQNYIIISVTKEDLADKGELTLLDYMNELKARGDFTFTVKDGMVTSINGIENSDKYWMLYTSDDDNSNSAWGTAEHNGKKYASSVYGADKLTLKPDNSYLWIYKAVN